MAEAPARPTPEFHLDGFDGSLDLLLELAEREHIDLARISVGDMVDQFVAAMARHERHVKLEHRADWLVLVARLVLLRSRLFLPGTQAADTARLEAERERDRLRNLTFVRAASVWLGSRPQLGQDVFARPQRGHDRRAASTMRLMEACLAVLVREAAQESPQAAQIYRLALPAPFGIADALARMRAMLAGLTTPMRLTGFLPMVPTTATDRDRRARSAVSSIFVATLELARAAELVLTDGENFADVSAKS